MSSDNGDNNVDPSSLGDIVEGELSQNSKGTWVIMTSKGERAIEDYLKKYSGDRVRFTFASLNDLNKIKDMMQTNGDE
jgi:hypothetical protein